MKKILNDPDRPINTFAKLAFREWMESQYVDGTINDAVDYVQSVARKFKGRYTIDGILEILRRYERPNDENYADFVKRFLSDDEIEQIWNHKY
jgi:hypothetical protein